MGFSIKLLKIIELTLFFAFLLLIVYFLVSGASSVIGWDKSWPYPQR